MKRMRVAACIFARGGCDESKRSGEHHLHFLQATFFVFTAEFIVVSAVCCCLIDRIATNSRVGMVVALVGDIVGVVNEVLIIGSDKAPSPLPSTRGRGRVVVARVFLKGGILIKHVPC